ncbi:lethal(2)neighbour of tid protein [Sitophilus oryzae]|uniref:dolichyl-P-Man:Man5GlcNAc2-PP-dolichol alpha-1,3-mannosyltransferase n=1 Tax=Sitophilus oryzae TaxID=7048 RepID=A0A6J2XWJ7_SITOR|nr:lethal(2)neighbour of tid protein [Sitophilus oryzae]
MPSSKTKLKAPTQPNIFKRYFKVSTLKKLVLDPHYLGPVCFLVFLFEACLNIFIIERVKYTKIDWDAYMQEVEGFLNGTWDYQYLKGETGPLVYPAGFVYLYTAFYYVTNQGSNVYLAQYIFLVLYLIQTLLIHRIYRITAKIPPYALILVTLTSYRIHSIFVLRLFNDPVAVLLFYISLNLFISNKWKLGSVFYSLAVSVKMNILLYAPCLLVAYLTNLSYTETTINLFICGFIQLVLAAPFLYTNPFSYIKCSFDLGRVFEHKWTVNYRFLSQHIFEHKYFHIGLLILHIFLLIIFLPLLRKYLSSYAKLQVISSTLNSQIQEEKYRKMLNKRKANGQISKKEKMYLNVIENQMKSNSRDSQDSFYEEKVKLQDRMAKISQLFVLPFFITNLIGVACARSLHYQFYSWYFHSLLYLVFCTNYRIPFRFLLLGIIEFCWNVYPSTNISSILLHFCHISLIFGVFQTMRA